MKSWFPNNYSESRFRFREAAGQLGATLTQIPVEVSGMSDLTIDVAHIGSSDKSVVIVTSGLHGVEGRCGAAIQLAWLAAQTHRRTPGRFVLVHALNPYGYSQGRRVNEDNIDLNRNFLDAETRKSEFAAKGTSDYGRFDALLNPAYPPRRIDSFFLKALGYLAREGRHRLQGAIVTGQYDYPYGLFYGGKRPSQTMQLVQESINDWVAHATQICHLDIHSGLGSFAQCQLLVHSLPGTTDYSWYETAFGSASLVATETTGSEAYEAHGAMGSWLRQRYLNKNYRFLTAEFGTYSALTVLSALRMENQTFHHGGHQSSARARARMKLENSFCPPSSRWRSTVVTRGVGLIEQAGRAFSEVN